MDEKDAQTRHVEILSESDAPGTKKEAVFSVALADAMARDNVSGVSPSMLRLYVILILVTLTNCMNGYDGSVMSSINAMKPFHSFFGVAIEGAGIGAVFAMYSVGQIVGCFVAAPAADIMGRRFGMSLGSSFIVIGTIIQASTKALGGFMGGRVLVGLGVTVVSTSAPVYLVELAYPSWRGIGGGLFNVCSWYVGALIASWTFYGTGQLSSDWSWRIPVVIQAVPACISTVLIWTLPESPRWLMMHGKERTARHVLVKYHGAGNPDSAVANLEFDEIKACVIYSQQPHVGQAWWDFRILWSSRPVKGVTTKACLDLRGLR